MSHAVLILCYIGRLQFAPVPMAWRTKKHVGGCFVLSSAASAPGVATICPSGNMMVTPLVSHADECRPPGSPKAKVGLLLGKGGRLTPGSQARTIVRTGPPGIHPILPSP